MPSEISYHAEEDYVQAVLSGTVNMDLLQESAQEVEALIEKYGTQRLLIDARNGQLKVTSLNVFEIAHQTEGRPVSHCRRALVHAPASSGYTFYEILTQCLNQNFREFTDMETAREWLLADETN